MALFCRVLFSQTLLETQFSAAIGSGARAMGMGGAFIAVADDATAVSWNPGGLGQIENIEISVVGSYYDFERMNAAIPFGDLRTGTYFQYGDSKSFDFAGITVPIKPFADGDFKIVIQYNYQRLINLNISSQLNPHYWEKHWIDGDVRYRAEGSEYAQENYEGGLDAHSIGLGLRIIPWINIGVSANIWTNGYSGTYFSSSSFSVYEDQTGKYLSNGFGTTMTYDEGDYTGTSFNFGVLMNLTSYLNFGMVYKTAFNFKDWDQEGNKKGEIHYPQSLGLGLSYRPIENLTLAVDITSTQWSEGKSVYGDEVLYFPSRMPYDENAERENEKQNNTNQLRFGAEYVFILDEFLLALRGGLYFDKQFFSDENLQIPTYTGIAGGAGLVWKSFAVDFAFNYEFGSYQADYYSAGKSDYSYLKVLASLILRF